MFSKSVSRDECKAGFGDFYTQIVNADKPHMVIPGRCAASNPEPRDSPMCNCTSVVRLFEAPRNDGGNLVRQNLRQKLLRAVAARLAEEIGLLRVLDDLAPVHEDHPVGH